MLYNVIGYVYVPNKARTSTREVEKAVAPRRPGVMPGLVDVRTKKGPRANQRMSSRDGEGNQVYDPRSSGPHCSICSIIAV